jgi:(2Fe-2S) ferredoxin
MEIVNAFKKKLKTKNLSIKVRAQKAGCLDVCSFGQTVVVYPEGIFYVGVELSDVDEIISEHIMNNRPVMRLVLDESKY